MSCLSLASRARNLPMVELLLAHCESSSAARKRVIDASAMGATALHFAAQSTRFQAIPHDMAEIIHVLATKVKALLDVGSEVNAVDRWGNSALHHACQACRGHSLEKLEVVQLLLAKGADSTMRNKKRKKQPVNMLPEGKQRAIRRLLAINTIAVSLGCAARAFQAHAAGRW